MSKRITLLLFLLLAGCGRGIEDRPADNPEYTSISGTAQAGASTQAVVTLKDSTGTEYATTTDANGNYSFDTQRLGIKAPAMLKAVFANTSTTFGLANTGNSWVTLDQANTLMLTLANTWTTLMQAYANFSLSFFNVMFEQLYQYINQLPHP